MPHPFLARLSARLLAYADLVRSRIEAVPAATCRRLMLAAIAIQLGCAAVAVPSEVMLHADSSWYLLGLVSAKPWTMVWHSLSARAAVYLATVLPTALIGQALQLSPMGYARLYGAIFYAVPALQLAVAAALVWRRAPQQLLYPVLGFAFGTLFVFGFPSEILLAPGFLWIALFLADRRRPTLWLLLPWSALVWTHEMALPSALVVLWLAVHRTANGDDWRRSARAWLLIGMATCVILAWLVLGHAGFNAGSSANAPSALNPMLIFDCPSAWVLVMTVAGIALIQRRRDKTIGTAALAMICVGLLVLPALMVPVSPVPDFARGRYASMRTVSALLMLSLALIAARAAVRNTSPAPQGGELKLGLPKLVALAYAAGVGTGLGFLVQWSFALQGYRAVVLPTSPAAPAFMPYEAAQAQMTPLQARTAAQTGFLWVLPIRSLLLADGGTPRQVIYQADERYLYVCATMRRAEPSPPMRADLYDRTRDFLCERSAAVTH